MRLGGECGACATLLVQQAVASSCEVDGRGHGAALCIVDTCGGNNG